MQAQTKTFHSNAALRAGLFACMVAALLAVCAWCAPQAFAAATETSVQTATVTPSYANPETGTIEDSGGSDNAELGQSMTESATATSALVEVDDTGTTYVTLRFNLMNEITQVTIEDEVNGTFQATTATETQTQAAGDDTAGDYRFAVNDSSDLLRVSLYVDPMGRSVVYFVQLSDLVDGNSAGFVASVTPGQAIASAEPAASDSSSSSSASDSSSSENAAPSADSSDDSSADSGVKEYNAEGDQVQDDGSSNRVPVLPVLIGICVVVVVIIAIVFAKNRSKRQAANQAAAAAAATAAQPKAKPEDSSKNGDK